MEIDALYDGEYNSIALSEYMDENKEFFQKEYKVQNFNAVTSSFHTKQIEGTALLGEKEEEMMPFSTLIIRQNKSL